MILQVDDSSRQRVINFLGTDVVKHAFAFYDIQYDKEHTTMHVALEDDKLKGYILEYTGADTLSVVFEGDNSVAEHLVELAPRNNFIIHAPPDFVQTIRKRFPSSKYYVEDWMLVKNNEAEYFEPDLARRLSIEDAPALAKLLTSRNDRPERALKRYVEWIKRMPLYGVFAEGELVSYAGSFIQLPQVWMIGGVYTDSNLRSKGFATIATSAVTKEALQNADSAALFVRSDNYPAITVYEKIGYKKIGEKVWVDVGTGLRP